MEGRENIREWIVSTMNTLRSPEKSHVPSLSSTMTEPVPTDICSALAVTVKAFERLRSTPALKSVNVTPSGSRK